MVGGDDAIRAGRDVSLIEGTESAIDLLVILAPNIAMFQRYLRSLWLNAPIEFGS